MDILLSLMEGGECGQSLAPEWLSFSRELPSSSQDKSTTKHNNDRDRPGRRSFGKQHSYHHLTHISPSSSHSYALQSSSSNWRLSDPNPRILNRSKSSPVFDSKENADVSKSPDRSNLSSVVAERHLGSVYSRPKPKIKGKPPLMSSRSQPNLFTVDKAPWQQPKLRSPPPSRPSLLSNSTLASASPPSSPISSLVPTNMAAAVSSPVHLSPSTPAVIPDDLDLEMEKLRILVPSPSVASAPKPPTRLVSNRKGSHPKPPGRPEKPATPPPNIHFRKATSEPSLLNNPNGIPNGDDVARKIRAIKAEKAKVALKETLEEQEAVVAKRNNFLMDVFKREKQIQDSSGEDVDNNTNVPDDAENFSARSAIPVASSTILEYNGETNSVLPEGVPLAHKRDLLAQNQQPSQLPTVEDEERFLRLLGWVPEEEDHVPELEEDEIAEVRLKINGQQQVLCK